MIEREVKLPIQDVTAIRAALEAAGWACTRPPYPESNTLYDTPGQDLLRAGKMLRVREVPGRVVLTVKLAPLEAGPHKAREEHEAELAEMGGLQAILQALDLQPAWRYEKRRSRYEREGEAGVIELDETPVGDFLELEGEADWIDRTAAALGFSPADYITASYRRLFVDARGEDGGDMVFA
ncbi:MAG: CYTH domain-containing protein [Acidobacteria bacterium]|nr:CYTH domain-containing protein [Acidobacteriota bacterium]